MSTNARSKGLAYCREVRDILKNILLHQVDGPFFRAQHIENRTIVIHQDILGLYDLISWDGRILTGHQVSVLENKSAKFHDFQSSGASGMIWLRSTEEHRVCYHVYFVDRGSITESTVTYTLYKKPKGGKSNGGNGHRSTD